MRPLCKHWEPAYSDSSNLKQKFVPISVQRYGNYFEIVTEKKCDNLPPIIPIFLGVPPRGCPLD